MKVSIIPIGNSKGVRLPKTILEECRFAESAELTVEKGKIVLTPTRTARAGWAEAFAAAPAGELSEEEREWLEAPLVGHEE
jgi:antitoxin MazE